MALIIPKLIIMVLKHILLEWFNYSSTNNLHRLTNNFYNQIFIIDKIYTKS
jgi:hypothetical protein